MFPKDFVAGLEFRFELGSTQVEIAKYIAACVHENQTDKSGAQYISHPARVVANLVTIPNFDAFEPDWVEATKVAAWLHDVVEDSGDNGFPKVTLENLQKWGIGQALTIIELLTRPEDKSAETQNHYYEAIAGHRAARYVKWADIADNLNIKRLEKLDAEIRARAERKYAHALEILHMDERQEAWLRERVQIDPETTIQSCPICKGWVETSNRYPDYICDRCKSRVVDENHAPVRFSNSESHVVLPRANGWIDGIEVYAAEAHFGGVVVRPVK